jgi:anthranilate synthase component 1
MKPKKKMPLQDEAAFRSGPSGGQRGQEAVLPLKASQRRLQADTFTPVGIYLRLRDAYPQSILLECSDYSSRHDSWSYICLQPLLGFEVREDRLILREPGQPDRNEALTQAPLPGRIARFMDRVRIDGPCDDKTYPGLFGFTAYDAASLFDSVALTRTEKGREAVPLLRYDLYQVVIAFNHFNDTLSICEVRPEGLEAEMPRVLSLLANRNATSFPFFIRGEERSLTGDDRFREMVAGGMAHCARGDVFQIVLSRRFEQDFSGDEFNVYRALRSVNPSPYLFYFDYLGYKLFGSSPEAQLRVGGGRAVINPIAGTVVRTGDPEKDARLTRQLLEDQKENSEHCMLVDLARNDLSKHADTVSVDSFREVQTYSHVIHLVSTVSGRINGHKPVYGLFADTFPAGTLTGAPKYRAMELIDHFEALPRGFYGGAIGFMGLDGILNHAIMIRSFMSLGGRLVYQAGAGVVSGSTPEGELREVEGKVSALRRAIQLAATY